MVGDAEEVLNAWKSMKQRIRQKTFEYQALSSKQLKERKRNVEYVPDIPYQW